MDKIICVGKNYDTHARELGDAVPKDPTYFFKPPSVLRVIDDCAHPVPLRASPTPHFELEVVFELAADARSFSRVTLGLDLTLRDIQSELKAAGLPWEKAKVFANAAIIGPRREFERLDDLNDQPFWLTINGVERQRGRIAEMRWSPRELIEDLGRWFPLRAGDLLFTGTPAGVGALAHGDLVRVEGLRVGYEFRVDLRSP